MSPKSELTYRQLSIAIKIAAAGTADSQGAYADKHGISRSTVSRLVRTVTDDCITEKLAKQFSHAIDFTRTRPPVIGKTTETKYANGPILKMVEIIAAELGGVVVEYHVNGRRVTARTYQIRQRDAESEWARITGEVE